MSIASHTIADSDHWCEPFEVRPIPSNHYQVSQIREGKIGYFVPVNYFTIDLDSFHTPKDIASTLPSDFKLSDGSILLPFWTRRDNSAIGW